MSSLYIHIPFCLSKCSYCSFNSYAGMESMYRQYVQALRKEAIAISFSREVPPLTTLFLGGGTPTVLPTDALEMIFDFCHEYFVINEATEISIEANPKTIDIIKLLSLRQAGVTRISIGVQSFVDEELQLLGRLHSVQDGWDVAKDAKSAGFSSVSLDLMSGIPGQRSESWRWSLETALSLEPDHLSLYQLTVEEGTPFQQQFNEGKLLICDEDEVLAMDAITEELCSAAGYGQYEISNYAQPGHMCRHNINYWENGEYLALGAGAVSYYQGERYKSELHPLDYCTKIEQGESVIVEREKLEKEASFRESVIMGLRMTRGVSLERVSARYNISLPDYYRNELEKLQQDGLVMLTNTHLLLTKKGRAVANQVMAELV